MFSLRDLIIFLAGAEFFHTLSHIFLAFYVQFPMKMKFMTMSSKMNVWAIIINAIITLVLIGWAIWLSK